MKLSNNIKVVPGTGELCPRCGKPTQVREHVEVRQRELSRPFYYRRWFYCTNQTCKTTLIMPRAFKVERDATTPPSQREFFP